MAALPAVQKGPQEVQAGGPRSSRRSGWPQPRGLREGQQSLGACSVPGPTAGSDQLRSRIDGVRAGPGGPEPTQPALPGAAKPGAPVLSIPAPSTPAPSTPAPSTPAPSPLAPSTPAPRLPAPRLPGSRSSAGPWQGQPAVTPAGEEETPRPVHSQCKVRAEGAAGSGRGAAVASQGQGQPWGPPPGASRSRLRGSKVAAGRLGWMARRRPGPGCPLGGR